MYLELAGWDRASVTACGLARLPRAQSCRRSARCVREKPECRAACCMRQSKLTMQTAQLSAGCWPDFIAMQGSCQACTLMSMHSYTVVAH